MRRGWRCGDGMALGAAHHGACHIKQCGNLVLTRHYELRRWSELFIECVDHVFKMAHHGVGDPRLTVGQFVAIFWQGCQLGHQHPHVAHDVHEHIIEFVFAAKLGAHHADYCLRFIDCTVSPRQG